MTRVVPRRNPTTKNNLFYPGAGYDFSTLLYFMCHSDITNFYYCDYYNTEYNRFSIQEELKQQFSLPNIHFEINYIESLHPQFYKKQKWEDFWHQEYNLNDQNIKNSFISIFEIKSFAKICHLYYFGTEAIETYRVLLMNNLNFDVVITQDHGLGGFWTTFCRGSMLENLSSEYNKMPKVLMVGEHQEAWSNYKQISEPFGNFGLHQHNRVLYKFIGN
jgi:hypothetical protein